jgi:hypothetical protein
MPEKAIRMSFGPEWVPMQDLIIGMWRKRKQTFSSQRVGSSPAANRLHAGSRGKYRYLSIEKNVQDGSVWLMIGKPQLEATGRSASRKKLSLTNIMLAMDRPLTDREPSGPR